MNTGIAVLLTLLSVIVTLLVKRSIDRKIEGIIGRLGLIEQMLDSHDLRIARIEKMTNASTNTRPR